MKAFIEKLRRMALSGLPRMYDRSAGLCTFRIKQTPGGIVPEGISRRYTAIALIGLAGEHRDAGPHAFHGDSCETVCGRLLKECAQWTNLGDVALTLWAARLLDHSDASRALSRLRELDPAHAIHPTVELAWTLTALSTAEKSPLDAGLAEGVAKRLLTSFRESSGLFSHMPPGSPVSKWRQHIVCFADFVYPTQALSNYGALVRNDAAINAAKRAASRICEYQGKSGQWWWHYDHRTGRIVEPFPVYSVHQDSMGPMALFAAEDASGADFAPGVRRGLEWLERPAEIDFSLIDDAADVIWRKVARKEPGKLTRGMQAVASWVHPSLRVPLVDVVFRPNWVDYESRPYQMGWILYAWSKRWTARFLEKEGEKGHASQARQMAGAASL